MVQEIIRKKRNLMNIIKKFLILVFLLTSAYSQKAIIDIFLPEEMIKRPLLNEIEVINTNDTLIATVDSLIIEIITSIENPATIVVKNGKSTLHKLTTEFKIWRHYFDKILYSELDNNNNMDILIISTPLGATGKSANIKQMIALLNIDSTQINYLELSSFFGAEKLIGDYNNNGKYEYGCIKNIVVEGREYYSLNLFSFEGVVAENISLKVKGFPIVLEMEEVLRKRIITNRNECVDFIFDNPNILKKK
jgi:hypothetical protein